ncbi:site-specific integrase [Naasia sp. SYSU D00948]|uniref:tyrosine-type recombinase/integrase n=1 Tax=Naasia sp. SYSU D00948 TaxID=2817379 RepID=UPI001B308219|nr:site-specific integrase [Naasia sp. SYSU D00948]
MSGRPRTDIGTFGEIRTAKAGSGKVQATTRIRDSDGRLRRLSATGATKAAAIAALKRKAANRDSFGDTGEAVTADTPVPTLARLWLEEVQMDPNLSEGTKETYERQLRTLLMPAFEHFTLREITVARVERFLKSQAAKSYARAKLSKVMLNLLMKFAMRHEAIRNNPVAATTPLRKPPAPPKALTMAELQAIRQAAATWRTAPGVMGPRPDGQVSGIIEVMLGSSARIGEALALRRCDVDMTANPPTVQFRGTVVVRKGKGVLRQESPKTDRSNRTVAIPQFAAEVIRKRLALTPDGDPEHLLFFTRHGTPLTPYNVRRTFRLVLDLAGLSGQRITPHSFRKTVATLISREANDEMAAEMLGHAATRITRQHYIERENVANPATAAILEKLAPNYDPDVP